MSDAYQPPPETTAAPDLPARLEPLLQLVAQQGREVIITQEGRPVARLVPYAAQPGDPPFPPPAAPSSKDAGPPAKDAASEQESLPLFGADRDILRITGDIESPIDVEWDAESNPDPLGRDRDIPQLTGDKNAAPAQGQEEPPILEDIIEIKDADGNVIRRTRFTAQVFGDIMAPIDVEWDAESNPDRVLNPC